MLRFCGQNKTLHDVGNLVAVVEINASKNVRGRYFLAEKRGGKTRASTSKCPEERFFVRYKSRALARIPFATAKEDIFVVTFAKLTRSFENRTWIRQIKYVPIVKKTDKETDDAEFRFAQTLRRRTEKTTDRGDEANIYSGQRAVYCRTECQNGYLRGLPMVRRL